jgi:fatty-acyl-CoA synthase
VQLKPNSNATTSDILKFLEGKTAKWWIPDDVAIVDAIPHTATGKIKKTELRDRFQGYAFPGM